MNERMKFPKRHAKGFTLLEVLIAILVTSLGLLGFAKMQALAVSSTEVASTRSIIAMQASSLAAIIHGNPDYWATGSISFKSSGTTITQTAGGSGLNGSTICAAASNPTSPLCTSTELAAYEVKGWVTGLNNLFPGATTSTDCVMPANGPTNCIISIVWTEKYVSATKDQASESYATRGKRSYTLYVQP